MFSPSDELYKQLTKVADDLTEELGRPVSVREALLQLIESMKLEPSDFSWSWRINKIRTKGEDKIRKEERGRKDPNRSEEQ